MKGSEIGIVLHRTSYSESSLIVTFYTKGAGIQKYIFQGAKKKNNAIFPLNICELTYYKRPDSELGKLTEANSLYPLTHILTNPYKSSIAFFMVDVLKHTLQTNQPEEELFSFLKNEIKALNETDSVAYFPLHFLAKLTEFIGISPSLEDNPRYFNLIEGEFHSMFKTGEIEIHGEACQQLYNLFLGENPAPAYKRELLNVLLHYYKIHTPRFDVTHSLEIIEEIVRN